MDFLHFNRSNALVVALCVVGLPVVGCDAGRPGRPGVVSNELEPAFDSHELSCLESSGSVESVGAVLGAPESELFLMLSTGCRSQLVIRSGGTETVVDGSRRIRLFATGTLLDDGRIMVCQTALATTPTARVDPEGAAIHHIDDASIECFRETDDGRFSGPSIVVADDGAAAWLTEVESDGRLHWLRDSTYDVGNLVRDDRPVTDGLWASALGFPGDDRVVVTAPIQEDTMPFGREGYAEM